LWTLSHSIYDVQWRHAHSDYMCMVNFFRWKNFPGVKEVSLNFSKVSSLLNLPCTATIELTFENVHTQYTIYRDYRTALFNFLVYENFLVMRILTPNLPCTVTTWVWWLDVRIEYTVENLLVYEKFSNETFHTQFTVYRDSLCKVTESD